MSCSNKNESNKNKEKNYINTDVILDLSSAVIGKEEYVNVWTMLNDSVENWEKHQLTGFIDKNTIEFKFDTLLCFNSNVDKMITARLARQLQSIGKLDAIAYYYGVKIDDKWNFFSGPTQFVSRKDLSKPTLFSELHQEALKKVFRGYLKKSSTGNWEINDSFFERIEFQYEKWAYWDSDGNKIDNSTLSRDSLTKLFLKKAVYEKWKTK